MFLIRKLVPSLNIEGRKARAGIIFIESKQNIFDEVEDSISSRGGLAHSINNGLIALFISKVDSLDLAKAAVDIIQKSKSLGVRAKVGINIGDVIIQELHDGTIKYASLGNSIVMAKKLAKIENSVVVNDEIQKNIESQFRFEKLKDGWLIKGVPYSL